MKGRRITDAAGVRAADLTAFRPIHRIMGRSEDMLRFTFALAPVLLALLLGACAQEPPPPRSAVMEDVEIVGEEVRSSPESARIVLDNPWITTVRVSLAPGERLTFHRGGERVVWAEGDYRLRLEAAGADPTVLEASAGQVVRHPSGPLTVENVGPADARYVMVVRSAEPLPTSHAETGGAPSLRQAGRERVELLWRDPVCRVLGIVVEPGGRIPRHRGEARVVYALGPYDLKYEGAGSDVVELAFQAGEAHWHEAGVQAVENLGSEPARYLVFAFLR